MTPFIENILIIIGIGIALFGLGIYAEYHYYTEYKKAHPDLPPFRQFLREYRGWWV